MKKTILAGVRRENRYSPNHVGNDAAIFNLTVSYLRESGYEVNEYEESVFVDSPIKERVIFNMSRSEEAIKKLQRLEDEGCVVVNSGYGIENCTREKMTNLLIQHRIPYPESLIVDTSSPIVALLQEKNMQQCWLKRGDFHAIHKEDVSFARHPEEAQSILQEYAMRGIGRAVINRHLVGDLIKFYGVRESDFFYWFYPFDLHHSKFGHEQINGKATGIPFSVEEMREICSEAATALHVEIYGGDCIISPDGEIRIIDLNDWPSFAPCRKKAAPYIGKAIEQILKNTLVPSSVGTV